MDADPELRYRTLWLVIGQFILIAIIYLSLTGSPVQGPDIPDIDKLFHMLAYFVLTFWFIQIYHRVRVVLLLAVTFTTLGIAMEVIQSFNPARFFEYGDMIANTLGVLLAVSLIKTRGRDLLRRLEDGLT